MNFLQKEADSYFSKITNANVFAEYTVLLGVFNALISRYFNDESSLIYSLKIEEKVPLLFDLELIEEKITQNIFSSN